MWGRQREGNGKIDLLNLLTWEGKDEKRREEKGWVEAEGKGEVG